MEVAERIDSLRRTGSSGPCRVLLGVRDMPLHQEILDFLEREPRIVVSGAATQSEALFRLIKTSEADATVVCPQIARDARHPAANGRAPNLLVIAEEMTVQVLREAIDAGAAGVFAWPEERQELARTIVRFHRHREPNPPGSGIVIAVMGARGGIGTTFLACQLAASFADEGRSSVLVDADVSFADVSAALGIHLSGDPRTAADLLPVAEEMSSEHVGDVLHRDQRGFDVLLAPADHPPSPMASVYETAIEHLSLMCEVVVVHVPRAIDDMARMAISAADEVVLLAANDSFSLHSARRTAEALGLSDLSHKCRLVINELFPGPVRPADVERAVGVQPLLAIRFDPSVGRFQDRGQLLPRRSRGAARDIRELARQLAASERSPRREM